MTRESIAKPTFRDRGTPIDSSVVISATRRAARIGSEELLSRMLRYGARRGDNPGLPGLAAARFAELCQHRRIPIPSPDQSKGA